MRVVQLKPADSDEDGYGDAEDDCPHEPYSSNGGCEPEPILAASVGEGVAGSTPAESSVAPDSAGILEAIKMCESGGDYTVVNSSGHGGAYQFDQGTWEAYGGTGSPASAAPEEQDAVAANAYAQAGTAPWIASVGCWG